MFKSAQKTRATGFSLLELLLVVGVGAVLILAGLSAYKLVAEGNSATQGIRQLQTLKQQVQSAYQGQAGYGTAAGADMTATMQAARMLPADMPLTGTNLRNAFGGTSTVVTGALVGGNAQSFLIRFNNVSRSACAKMGMVFSTASSSDFTGLTINATVLTAGQLAAPTLAIVSAACNVEDNAMTWTFQ